MTQHIPEEFSTRLIAWSPFVIMGNTMPPRDPDEDEEDEDEEDRADEPPVVREPDEGGRLRRLSTLARKADVQRSTHVSKCRSRK
jgi:hypothetical protein